MGSCLVCCTTCNCPRQVDTAIGRRYILNKSEQIIQENIYKSSSVKITTAYIEKPDGTLLYTKLFEPKDINNAKAMICYCIGFSGCISWMSQDIGVHYAELGFVVFMADWKGHGKSDGQFIHINNFEKDIVDEGLWIFTYAINKYIKTNPIYTQQIDKNNNYFISGASMGGAIALQIALKSMQNDDENDSKTSLLQQDMFNEWKGLVLIAPMVALAKDITPPQWQQWCLLNCCLPGCPNFKVVPNKVDSCLTKDKKLQDMMNAKPMKYDQSISLITGYNVLSTTLSIESNINKFNIPMYICHGDDDKVTDCKMSELFYENCGCDVNNKTLQIYKGYGHLLYWENPNVYKDSAKWIMQRIQNINHI